MPQRIDRIQLQKLMDSGGQVVDVLPKAEYEDQHIPGAINIPLKELGPETAGQLSKQQPVVAYCYDYQ